MRAVFGLVSLLVVLAIVGLLAKKQLSAVKSAPSLPTGVAEMPAGFTSAPAGATVQQQSQHMQQQFKDNLEKSLQQPRPMPEDKKADE